MSKNLDFHKPVAEPAPALPGILPMRALKESESTVDNGNTSVQSVSSFCEAGAEKSSFSCLDSVALCPSFALGHDVHFTCIFLPFTSRRLK